MCPQSLLCTHTDNDIFSEWKTCQSQSITLLAFDVLAAEANLVLLSVRYADWRGELSVTLAEAYSRLHLQQESLVGIWTIDFVVSVAISSVFVYEFCL